jgi:hypothetical protein
MSSRITEQRNFGPHLDWQDLPIVGAPPQSPRRTGLVLVAGAVIGLIVALLLG